MAGSPNLPKPVYMGEGKPLKLHKSVEDAVLYAIKGLVKQSKALAEADYTTFGTVKSLRRELKLEREELAEKLGVSVNWLKEFEGVTPVGEVAKALRNTGQTINDVYRLLSFASGGPDSRPEITLGDLLKYLTAEQFDVFVRWVEEGKARPAVKPPDEDVLQ